MIWNKTRSLLLSLISASVLILALLTFSVGRPQSSKKQYVVVGENDNGTQKALRLSQLLLLNLSEKSGTGYGWQVVRIDREFLELDTLKDEELASMRKNGLLPELPEEKSRFGGADWQVFRMKPRKAGTTSIELDYARPWQPEKPAKKFTLSIVVER